MKMITIPRYKYILAYILVATYRYELIRLEASTSKDSVDTKNRYYVSSIPLQFMS